VTSRTKPNAPKIPAAAERLAKREVDYGLDDRLIPLPAVIEITGLGKTMIYAKMRKGEFPRQCKPGGVSSRWSEAEVKAWKEGIMAQRDAA
jgi:prophage regulatory protein